MTFEELAGRLKVSKKTAHEDVMAMADLYRAPSEQVDLMRARSAANVRELLAPHMAKKRNVGNARIAKDLLEFEARLFGLPKKPEGTYTVEQVVGMLRALASDLLNSFPDDEQRRAILAAFRRRLGQGQGAAIDVTAGGEGD